MTTHQVSRVLISSALALGMGVASWGYGAPHPQQGGTQGGAYLGVMVNKVPPETAAALHVASGGTMIANVDQDGPACHAGLKGGDIVTAFNGKAVGGPEQFAEMIHANAPGSTVTLTVLRNGKSQDMRVKLGDWKEMAAMPPLPPRAPLSPAGTMPPMAPFPPMPAFDVPGFSPLLAHSGILVEPLSSQLGEYFGAPQNEGVLVRSVDKGSPGAAAGLKAGDVVVKVNNETIHDLTDWKRALRTQGGKLTLSIVRERRPQTLQMNLTANTSELQGGEWDAREFAELAQLTPQQLDEINRQAKAAAKAATPEMKKQAEEMRKQAEQIRKEMATMAPEFERQAREMAESVKPSSKELNDMAREWQKTMKEMQPELQKQMEEFQKEWQKEMREWQDAFKSGNPRQL